MSDEGSHIFSDLQLSRRLERAASQRNAERQGFRIAYTRVKWSLAA